VLKIKINGAGGDRIVQFVEVHFRGGLIAADQSVATSERCLQTLCGKYGFSICDASKLLSLAPAKLLGVDGEMGSIVAGKAADLVLADDDFNVTGVILNGKKAI